MEVIAPADPEVQMLIGDAQAGLEQSARRELIARLEEQVALANTLEQLQIASSAIQEALANMPAESALFRLSAQADRRMKEFEHRRLVEETFYRCRDLRPREAIDLVRAARERLPDDEKLLSLERVLKERLQQQSVEERRGEYLSRAREALKGGRYADAVHILEACEAEGIANPEALSLLEFARTEEKESTSQNLKRSKLIRAQYLVNQGEYEEAVGFLTAELGQSEDATLRMLLDQAKSAREAAQRQAESSLAAAGRLVQAGKVGDALQLLSALPRDVLRSGRVQMAIAALEDEQSKALFRMTGRAYAMLGSNLAAGHRVMQRVAAGSTDSSATAAVTGAFRGREQAWADRALAEAAQTAETLVRNRDLATAEKLVRETDLIARLASPERRPFREGSGRLELARAIASKDNPLTARVMVNRAWLHHFGRALVTTPSDFGLRSDPPSHPELLDYLAAYFVGNGWSVKKLHRLIVLSAAYRQASADRPDCRRVDPENALLWRMSRRRLDFEATRDALLAVSGQLNGRVGGPSVRLR